MSGKNQHRGRFFCGMAGGIMPLFFVWLLASPPPIHDAAPIVQVLRGSGSIFLGIITVIVWGLGLMDWDDKP
jgi:hypothetical protein